PALSSVLLTFPILSAGYGCGEIVAQKQRFNLEALKGPHLLYWENDDISSGRIENYTFHIDICNTLKRKNGGCHGGARICAERVDLDLDSGTNTTHHIDVAGTFKSNNGGDLDAQFSLLSDSKSHSDADREGLRAELHGGRYPFVGKNRMDQMAIIEFVCDRERSGLEGDTEDKGDSTVDDDKDKKDDEVEHGDDNEDNDKGKLVKRQAGKCEDSDASLRFCGFDEEKVNKDKKARVLRLEWRTQYACQGVQDDTQDSHWGFFTWFIIILFLVVAAYLIFGSWLNYNRYGARGWDLLPHGDTIRDIPYILKDWARRVASTIQGPGSRGGYSAV
ncbi:hypothetical protein CC78DRAFT_429013, partial [Lojkania enalia]